MIRRILFWVHLSMGAAAGVFIFIMAATGVLLSFERQIINLVDRDVQSVSVPSDGQPRGMNELLETARRARVGEPTALIVRNGPEAAIQFSIGRNKAIYLDPYGCAVLGSGSARTREFFGAVERLHRSLGWPLGSKTAGHWVAAIANLLFGALIVLGMVLWLPRKWSWKAVRAAATFRAGLRGRAREWNWHNVVGIWCSVPLLVIVLTGVVMSFDWANALLFRLSGSALPAHGHYGDARRRNPGSSADATEPDYQHLVLAAKRLQPGWRTITLNLAGATTDPISLMVDTGTGGQPQKRTQYFVNRNTGAVMKTIRFADGSLGQRLRAFVRFGHTGEYGGFPGQLLAALSSLGGCVLVYSGLALTTRRFTKFAVRTRGSTKRRDPAYKEDRVA
jgi:uncharacterized iron-regulated membrane protein